MKTHANFSRILGFIGKILPLLLSFGGFCQAQYENPPPIVSLGGGSIAAYPPPHELVADPRILDTLTREIFLQQGAHYGVVDSGGNPLKPVPTSDWWTHMIMEGDGGEMWQYPITVKAVASGVEIKQIGGLTASSNGGSRSVVSLLRIGGVELAGAGGSSDITLADFEGGTTFPAGWTVTGRAGILSLATFPGTPPSNFQGTQFATTKLPNDGNSSTPDENDVVGNLTTASFPADRSYAHFRMGGGNDPKLRAELLVNNSVVATVQRSGGSGAALAWQKLDLRSYAGQDVKLRFVDEATNSTSWGYFSLDQIVLSNNPVDPVSRVAASFDSNEARVSGWSDWMFTFRKTDKTDAAKTMDVTLGRNLPFVWVEANGIDPRLTFDTNAVLRFRDAGGVDLTGASFGTRDTLSIEVDGKFYGIHVGEGTGFEYASGTKTLIARLPAGQRHLVVSALPRLSDLATFSNCAYAKPLTTRVNYTYNPASADGGAVRTQWTYTVQSLRPGATNVLQGWLPPHYRGNEDNLTFIPGADFETPRGKLRCAVAPAATGFSIDYQFNGVMSQLARPELLGLPNDFDEEYLTDLLEQYDEDNDGVCNDTYFGAKNLVLHARAMHMAKELGMTATYQNLKTEIKASLADWFTYVDGETNHYFARNDRWGSLIGFNFIWDFNLGRFTDIHFHYGYYLLAYAYVAMDDAEFRDQYKEIAIEIGQSYANWDRNSTRYPWMRTFEPMVGHSYAGGSSSGGGNNQESSSESIQSWAGLFLLGEALRGNDPRSADIMAAGAFGYAIETRAVLEYYQDYHGSPYSSKRLDYDNQPAVGNARYPVWPDEYRFGRTVPGFPAKQTWIFTNGIMTDSSNNFGTYFGAQPEYIYGIQWLPNAPHMLFLAEDPAFTGGQFGAFYAYRDEHYARMWMGTVSGAPATLRTEWHKTATVENPDPRLYSIDNPWSGTDMKGLVNTLFDLNPAFVRDISHEGDPVRDNPLYNQATGTWLVQFPAGNVGDVTFPAAIWTPDVLTSTYPHLVPPALAADLPNYSLTVWSTQGFSAFSGNGAPAVDWALLASRHGWNPADYPNTPAGRTASVSQLVTAMEDIGGSWPLIALCFKGFSDPEFAIDVVAECRRRNNRFVNHTETGMFNYYYFTSMRGLGTLKKDQHLAIPSSLVFQNETTGARSYMVHNKSPNFELVNVFENGAAIGQVLAKPASVTVQHGLYATANGFSAIGTVPSHGSAAVSATTDEVVVVFNEPINLSSANSGISLSGPGGLTLTSKASGSPQLAVFKVNGNWQLGATYTVNVAGSISNLDGTHTLGAPAAFSFTIQTPFGLDLTASTPAAGAANVDPSLERVELQFNSVMNTATLTGVTLTGAGNPALAYNAAASSPGRVVYDVSRSLKPGSIYTINVPAGIADVYGQSLGVAETIQFTTEQASSVLDTWDTTLNVTRLIETARSAGDTSRALDGGLLYEFNTVGDFVEFTIHADQAGVYRLQTSGKNYSPRGDFRLLLNGTLTGPLWDLSLTPHGIRTFDFGNLTLLKGANTFRFEATALNNAGLPWFHLIDLFFTPIEIFTPNYAGFRLEHFGPGNPPNSAGNEDFDRDGRSNFLEFAFGTDPKTGAGYRDPMIEPNASVGKVKVSYRKAVAGLTYVLQRSGNLGSWTPMDMSGETYNAGSGRFSLEIPWNSAAGPLFLQMKVSEPAAP
ncbi:MAG: glycosyl hydrolase [Verrucomicrobiota bacterium]